MYDNEQILSQIVHPGEKAVFKSMREDMETGKALLNPEQLGRFLRSATINQTILKDAHFDLMKSFKKELANVGLNGRVLQSGYKADKKTTNEELDGADVDFGYAELDAKKLKAMCSILDDEKDDNMEQAQFEQTLLTMMGERVGEDLEIWSLFADTDINYSSDKLLSTTDGWIKSSTNKLVDETDFNVAENTVEAMFDAMIYAMPLRFRQNRNALKFYVPFEVEDAYRNLLKSRNTALGDTTQTGFSPLTYKNIPVVYCPSLDDEMARAIDSTGTSILANPQNLYYGIWKNISIEPDRIVKAERTDYYYRMRADVTQAFPQATVTAKIGSEELADLPEQSKL